MAAAAEPPILGGAFPFSSPPPPNLLSPQCLLPFRHQRTTTTTTTRYPIFHTKKHHSISPLPRPCASRTLDPAPAGEGPSPVPPDAAGSTIGREGGGSRDRRRAVRIAWEKLVRWSRSLRSKARTDVFEKTNKVAVLGGGSFGTAMAAHLASRKAEMEVSMLLRDEDVCRSINDSHLNCKYFPDHKLPVNIVATTNAKAALSGADFCLHAVPVQCSSSFLRGISQHVDSNLPFISLSKGLELNTLKMMSQIIPQALGNPRQPFTVLSGPSFAVEILRKLPTVM